MQIGSFGKSKEAQCFPAQFLATKTLLRQNRENVTILVAFSKCLVFAYTSYRRLFQCLFEMPDLLAFHTPTDEPAKEPVLSCLDLGVPQRLSNSRQP